MSITKDKLSVAEAEMLLGIEHQVNPARVKIYDSLPVGDITKMYWYGIELVHAVVGFTAVIDNRGKIKRIRRDENHDQSYALIG
jgi:hypothetical protein